MGKKQSQRFMTWVTNWLISPSNKTENIKKSRFYEKQHEESIMSLKPRERFPGGSVMKSLPANAGDTDSIPDAGRYHMARSNEGRGPQLLSLYCRAGSCNC